MNFKYIRHFLVITLSVSAPLIAQDNWVAIDDEIEQSPKNLPALDATPEAPAAKTNYVPGAMLPAPKKPAQPQFNPKTHFPNGTAAIVEDRVITMDDVQRKVIPFIPQLQRESRNMEELTQKINAASKQVLENMIDDYLLIHEFKSNERLKIPETFFENHYTKLVKEQFGEDRNQFMEYLDAQGTTEREFRKEQQEQLVLGFVRNEMRRNQSEISPDKISRYYEEHRDKFQQHEAVHMRQIIVKPIPGDDDGSQLKKKTEAIMNRLKHNEDFEIVAKENSEDDMAKSGGDWGWINRDDIRKELADVAFKLHKGRFSQPIYLSGHAFIIFVQDIRQAGYLPLSEVRKAIETQIINDLAQKVHANKIDRLRSKAHIKYFI